MFVISDPKIGMPLVESVKYPQTDFFEKIKIDIIVAGEIGVEIKYFFDENHKTMYIELDYSRKVELNRSTQ